MLLKDVKVGMKVVPHSKRIHGTLEDSYTWREAIKRGQNYLFVVGFNCYGVTLDTSNNREVVGDYFSHSDFEPYTE